MGRRQRYYGYAIALRFKAKRQAKTTQNLNENIPVFGQAYMINRLLRGFDTPKTVKLSSSMMVGDRSDSVKC